MRLLTIAAIAASLGCGAAPARVAAGRSAGEAVGPGGGAAGEVGMPGAGAGRARGTTTGEVAGEDRSQVVRYVLYEVGGKGRPVLLVHGWAGTAREMQYMGEGIRGRGYSAWSLDLLPGDARVADTARAMALAIDEVLGKTRTRKVSLVAHSMGGLDSRYYLAMMLGTSKVDRLITIASPHHGTIWGGLAHGEAKIDLRPGSELLRTLDSFGKPLVPTTSIFSWTDQTVVPQGSAILEGATNRSHWGLTHAGTLRSPEVLGEVLAALATP